MELTKSEVFVVFGGSGGIGGEIARQLYDAGASVAVTGRDCAHLQSLKKDRDILTFEMEASKNGAIDETVSAVIEKYGRVDGVVNCIGSVLLKPAHLTKDNEWEDVIDVNLTSSFKVLRASASAMMKTGGSIVLMSSAAARVGLASHEAIAAAKAGIIGMARSAAATYARRKIRVNCVAPGLVHTSMTRQIVSSEAALHASQSMHALGRIGEPEDIANAVVWLLTPSSTWVTGQVLGVDGGLSMVRPK